MKLFYSDIATHSRCTVSQPVLLTWLKLVFWVLIFISASGLNCLVDCLVSPYCFCVCSLKPHLVCKFGTLVFFFFFWVLVFISASGFDCLMDCLVSPYCFCVCLFATLLFFFWVLVFISVSDVNCLVGCPVSPYYVCEYWDT